MVNQKKARKLLLCLRLHSVPRCSAFIKTPIRCAISFFHCRTQKLTSINITSKKKTKKKLKSFSVRKPDFQVNCSLIVPIWMVYAFVASFLLTFFIGYAIILHWFIQRLRKCRSSSYSPYYVMSN